MIRKEKKQEKNKNNEIKELDRYERIGNLTFKLETCSSIIFTLSIIPLAIILLFGFFYFFGKRTPENAEFYTLFLPLTFVLSIIAMFALMVISVVIQSIANLYRRREKYNIKKVISLLFYELSEKPEKKRKIEIIKHLTYNLRRLTEGNVGFRTIPGSWYWQSFHDIKKQYSKFIVNTIERSISFVGDFSTYLDSYENPHLLREIGDCFQKGNYQGIAKIFNQNKKLFKKIDEIKEGSFMTRSKEKLQRAKNYIEWISLYGKGIVTIIAFLILLILYILGIYPTLPGT